MLLVASYVFYGWWDWRFLSLLFISTISDFIITKSIGKCGENRKGTKTALLVTSLTINLSILGFFKYFNFFAQSFERVVAPLGLHPDFLTLNILLPVGISFYTFQTMAYTIDVYRGNDNPCKNFWDFALYVAFFPSLVAGPIERSTNLIPQIQKRRSITRAMIFSACQLILMGYFKKVFIADGVAPIVNECFATPDKFGGITLFFAAVLFMIQVYGDFSGYTDIARGVARMFGIEVMVNFKQPFLSANITEFWQHWHISLMLWFKDYVYIPLLYSSSQCTDK
jgi:D-alanyl-lipoteichoic acid acyltransferase DltB (MBOAT superfamily)